MKYKYLVLFIDLDYEFFKSLEDLKNSINYDFFFDFDSITHVFSIDYINGQMFLQQIMDWKKYID